jgi:tetratricopeptide (TPR) repeat protein
MALLELANDLREEDKLAESLIAFDKAINESIESNNYSNHIEALLGKVLTYKHLFLLYHKASDLNSAIKNVHLALAICRTQKINSQLSVSYFRLGEMNMLSQDYQKAIKNYRQSLKLFGPPNAEKGDYTYHLGEAVFRSGDSKKGKSLLLKGLKILKKYQSSTDSFLIHVWLSGCYLRLAELLKSPKYLTLAQNIIENDDQLIIRKRQLKELSKSVL